MSENLRPQRNFRSLVIEPFQQMKIGLYVFIISIIFLVIASVLFVNAFMDQYKHIMAIFEIVDEKVKWELVNNDVFRINAIRIGALFFSYAAILFLVVIGMTHRFYGPLVSVERFVDQLTEGQYQQRIRIRKKDELQELTSKLNMLAAALEKRYGSEDSTDNKKDRRMN